MDDNSFHQAIEDFDDYEEYEEEVEEMADDMPMFISDRIYLGSIDAACNAEGLKAKNIRMMLSLLSTYDNVKPPLDDIEQIRVDVEDDLVEPLFSKLPYLVYCIKHFIESSEGNILVHCIAGMSRSPSAVIAYLMIKNNINFDAALELVRLSRPWVDPNPHFQKQLALFRQILTSPAVCDNEIMFELSLTTSSLPRLHFHPQFVHSISLHQTKILTLRLESDKVNDSNSDLASIYQYSTVVACTDDGAFSYLHITEFEVCTIDALTIEHAKGEGLSTVADLRAILDQFYPRVAGTAKVLCLHFRLLGNIVDNT